MSGVPFVCQRCKQPLRIHDSLVDISPAAFDLLAGTLPKKNRILTKQVQQIQIIQENNSPHQDPLNTLQTVEKSTKKQHRKTPPHPS